MPMPLPVPCLHTPGSYICKATLLHAKERSGCVLSDTALASLEIRLFSLSCPLLFARFPHIPIYFMCDVFALTRMHKCYQDVRVALRLCVRICSCAESRSLVGSCFSPSGAWVVLIGPEDSTTIDLPLATWSKLQVKSAQSNILVKPVWPWPCWSNQKAYRLLTLNQYLPKPVC